MEMNTRDKHLLGAVFLSACVAFVGGDLGAQNPVAPIQISNVIGLANALAIRPLMGVGYTAGATAVINSEAQLDGAAGTPSDCVYVDGTTGPCGGGTNGSVPNFSDGETPQGLVNGSNPTFALANTPIAGSVHVFDNGIRMQYGIDLSVSGKSITFMANSIPQSGATLLVDYRF
jgi:hypothetical protein